MLSVGDITKSVARIGEKERRSNEGDKTEIRRWKQGCIDRDSSSFRERGNKWEKASSCGLAELTMNLGRFIFSGACCSLKGGQIYMPLPGLLWSSVRGAEDGISGLMGRDGGFSQVMGVTPSGRGKSEQGFMQGWESIQILLLSKSTNRLPHCKNTTKVKVLRWKCYLKLQSQRFSFRSLSRHLWR